MSVNGKRIPLLLVAIALLIATIIPAFQAQPVYADDITLRSLTLQAGTTDSDSNGIPDGGSMPGGVVNHRFDFTLPAVGDPSVGSIKFEYCTIASGTCTVPTGLVTDAASVNAGTQTGATGFTLVNESPTPNGAPYLTRTAATITAGQVVSYQLLGITNPTTTNETFFVRISTYASTDTTGTPIDTGTVAASTANAIELSGVMPESLIFCTGATVSVNGGGIPDCSTATAGNVSFNQLFSPSDTATATSQMAASTNASTGYVITANGPTLTSGANTIPDMDVAANSTVGAGQFGMNLVANTGTPPGPVVGANVEPIANTTNFKGIPATGFDTDGTYRFDGTAPNIVAASNAGGAGPTDSQIFTASYIVNVSGSQPAGTYVTTLTYICTPTF